MATRDATWAYRNRFHESFARTYFRRFADGLVSSIGVGTYLGDPTDAVDEQYHDALVEAFESGINVVDTAINYRCQRSERVVGRAVADADVDREELLVATKGGFVPFDGSRPADPGEYVEQEYGNRVFVRGNCLQPDFIDDQFDRSRSNLDLETIDLYYLHNPETQLEAHSQERVYEMIESAFERLEQRVAADELRHYGVASWNAFRVPQSHDSYLSLPEVVRRARAAAKTVGNASTSFRAIQLPFNIHMADAFTIESHEGPDGNQSALWFAQEAGIDVFTSASILQGDLTEGVPERVATRLDGDTAAQRAINFARSAPGVTCSLVGMSSTEHVKENVAAGTFPPLGADAFDSVFE